MHQFVTGELEDARLLNRDSGENKRNYTGDRLNFGLAIDRAKSEGYTVEMAIVGDDCALLPSHGTIGRRGLAGTVIVNKVAGTAAVSGLTTFGLNSFQYVITTSRVNTWIDWVSWILINQAPVGGRPPLNVPLHLSPSSSSRNIKIVSRPQELSTFGCILEAAIEAAAKEIIRMKDCLNEWDTRVGDVDCGTTMERGATSIIEDMKNRYPLSDAAETLNELGATIRRAMGGTSGILYAILCSAAHTSLMGHSQPTPREWAKALAASIDAVSKYGGARAGHRTMLDALVPASNTLTNIFSSCTEIKCGVRPYRCFCKIC